VRVPSPGMEPTLVALRTDGGFLRTSPEFALKRVLAAGLPRIYEMGPCFRAEERGRWHGTEFTMLEWYRVGANLSDLMDEVESLIAACCEALGRDPFPAFLRTTVQALYRDLLGVDLSSASPEQISPDDPDDWEGAFFRRWVADIEPQLTAPVFVSDWPASMAALAQVRTERAFPTAERFEAYLGGVELANAFQELVDPAEQTRRFADARERQEAEGLTQHPIDEAFIEAVGKMPRTAGIALGVDRLVAVLCGWDAIHPGRVSSNISS